MRKTVKFQHDKDSCFNLRKVINGKELEYCHSFLSEEEALEYIKRNRFFGEVVKSGKKNILYDVYGEIEDDSPKYRI